MGYWIGKSGFGKPEQPPPTPAQPSPASSYFPASGLREAVSSTGPGVVGIIKQHEGKGEQPKQEGGQLQLPPVPPVPPVADVASSDRPALPTVWRRRHGRGTVVGERGEGVSNSHLIPEVSMRRLHVKVLGPRMF